EGEAKNVKIVFNIPEEIEIVKGKRETTIDMLPANGEVEMKITLNVPSKDAEKEEYSISADLEYFDMVGTAYSITIGPVKITLHLVRESEKLKKETKDIIKKMSDLKEKIKDFPKVLEYVFLRLIDDIKNAVNKSEDLLRKEKLDEVKINLRIVDFVLNEISQLLADKGFEEKVKLLKEQIKKAEKQENVAIRTSENKSEENGG
ncbi:MAG: hypothetical protein ACTSW6_05040, partial [Candidatus Baldrarchaeia archaeon]